MFPVNGSRKHTNMLSSALDIQTAFLGHTTLYCTYGSYAGFLPEGIEMRCKVGLEILYMDYTLENKFCNFVNASQLIPLNSVHINFCL